MTKIHLACHQAKYIRNMCTKPKTILKSIKTTTVDPMYLSYRQKGHIRKLLFAFEIISLGTLDPKS